MSDPLNNIRSYVNQQVCTDQELIKKYNNDFELRTGRNLITTIINLNKSKLFRQKQRFPQVISLKRILEIVDNEIPIYLKDKYPSIAIKSRKEELPVLRKVFTGIAILMNHSRKNIKLILNVDHTTIIYHLHCVQDALSLPESNMKLFNMYHIILDKINIENARTLQSNIVQQPNPKSDLLALLHT